MKINLYDVIQEPLITEKVTVGIEKDRRYGFKVHKEANKKQIKSAIEAIFNVHVTKVNVMVNVGKWRRIRFQPGKTAEWKKAIVTIKEGEKIDLTA